MPKGELPSNRVIATELLRHLYLRGKPVSPQDLYAPLADTLKLTPYQLSLKPATTNESKWHNRVQAARDHLAKKGFIPKEIRSRWSLTQAGVTEAIKRVKLARNFKETDEKFGIDWHSND